MKTGRFCREKWPLLLSLVLGLAVPAIFPGRYAMQVITMSCIFAIATLSLNLITGYTGQVSLAHAGFFAIGAYGVALLTKAGFPFWLALFLAALLTAAVSFLVGLPTLRTRGSYFAIASLCFGVIVSVVAGSWRSLTGGYTGITGIPLPGPIFLPFAGEITFQSKIAQYYLVLAFLIFTYFIIYRIVNSPLGLSFMAARNNETLAGSVGISTFAAKLLSFVVASFFAGIAGGIYASLLRSISPEVASYELTFSWLVSLLLGGLGTMAGPVIGSLAVSALMEYLQSLVEYRPLIFGAVLVIAIIYFPRGIMGEAEKLRGRIAERYLKRRRVRVESASKS